jgi:hypothetical protein
MPLPRDNDSGRITGNPESRRQASEEMERRDLDIAELIFDSRRLHKYLIYYQKITDTF